MYLDIKIGPYKLEQRTEYSKIKVYDMEASKDISNTSVAKKLLKDYNAQMLDRNKYLSMSNNCVEKIKVEAIEDKIKYLFIPNGIEVIKAHALENGQFNFISLPNTLERIHNDAFYNCTNLECINIPDSVTSIKFNAFNNCTSLKNIKLSENINTLEDDLFNNCTSLKKLVLPDSIEGIHSYVFCNCIGLENIKLPKNLKSLSCNVFENCKSLSKIDLPDSVVEIGEECFINCENLEEIKLSDNMCFLDDKIFYNVKKLKSINVPERLTTLYGNPFEKSSINTLIINHDLKNFEFAGYLDKYNLLASNVNELIIGPNVKKITTDIVEQLGFKIKSITYQNTKEEFNKFKNNNKELFDLFTNLEKINFIDEKEKDDMDISETER